MFCPRHIIELLSEGEKQHPPPSIPPEHSTTRNKHVCLTTDTNWILLKVDKKAERNSDRETERESEREIFRFPFLYLHSRYNRDGTDWDVAEPQINVLDLHHVYVSMPSSNQAKQKGSQNKPKKLNTGLLPQIRRRNPGGCLGWLDSHWLLCSCQAHKSYTLPHCPWQQLMTSPKFCVIKKKGACHHPRPSTTGPPHLLSTRFYGASDRSAPGPQLPGLGSVNLPVTPHCLSPGNTSNCGRDHTPIANSGSERGYFYTHKPSNAWECSVIRPNTGHHDDGATFSPGRRMPFIAAARQVSVKTLRVSD